MATWIAAGMCLLFLVILNLGPIHHSGRSLFLWLFALGCISVVTSGFRLTADLFSEERRNGTLGLLVLTGLRPLEIFAYKSLGAVLLAAYGLLGALPFFAVPFLTGGVPADQFFCALLFLANGLLFCVAMGLLASVMHRDGGQAQVTAIIITLFLCLAGPAVYALLITIPGAPAPSWNWLELSPGLAPAEVFGKFTAGASQLFWASSTYTLLYSLTALLSAAVILQRTWRDQPDATVARGWRARFQKWTRGGEQWQRRLRARYLSHQPLCWVAARDRVPVLFSMLFLGIMTALWLGALAIWSYRWLRPPYAFLSSTVVHVGLNWILAYAAGRHLAEERQSGGFEVLLTTPVSSGAIIRGQAQALLMRFRGIFMCAFLLDWLFCASTAHSAGRSIASGILYVLVWAALMFYWFAAHLETSSLAMWISAWTGRAGYSAVQAIRTPLLIPFWLGIFFAWIVGAVNGGNAGWLLPLIILLPAAFSSFARRRAIREKLGKELKWIAAAAIPSRHDKRFKSWNPQAIYAPGRWGELELRPATPRKRKHHHNPIPAPLRR